MIGYEQQRLTELGHPELFQRLDWVSDTQGDGAGFDILSFEEDAHERFIEVKTTNG
ncbi:protein NO VEIN domain-containing protein, partial [Acinetobacter baumannii]